MEDSGAPHSRKALLQQQQQARFKLRHQKLKLSFVGYVIVLVFLALLQAIGVFLFTKGFLLSRQVLPNVSDCGNDCVPPVFDKAVVLVIDALRFDFTIPVDGGANPYYHNNFPVLHQLMDSQPDNAILLKFLADPPTTTLQRLKGLTTGSLPTFIDAGSNFDGDAIDEDNWLLQLHRNNRTVAFMGDDTWSALFSAYIHPDLHFPYDSLNVWDLHSVDNGVLEHLTPLLQRPNDWDVLVGHFLGVDHAGHRYGPDHHAMKEKLIQMNQVIADTVRLIDDSTLLVVMGDHGMDPTGNHGGESKEELESAVFFYSRNKNFHVFPKDAVAYNTSRLGADYRAVNQIDLVPTLSLLLGLPIPYNNLGFPIDEVFGLNEGLMRAAQLTLQQLHTYKQESAELRGNSALDQKYHAFVNLCLSAIAGKEQLQDLIADAKAYQSDLLELCKSLWARFDLLLISLGVAVMILSFSFLVTYSRSIPSVRVLTMSFEFIGSVIAMCLLGLVLSLSIFVVLKPDMNLRSCLLVGCSSGITIGFWAPIMDRFSVMWLWHQILDFFVYNLNSWLSLGLLFVLLHCAIFASNSYVIWEDKLIDFFMATFGFCCLYACFTSTKPKAAKILNASHAVTFIFLSRVVSLINLCREEQRPYCVPTFKTTWWSVCLLYVAAFLLPRFVKSFYKLTESYHSAAPLWVETGMTFFMFMNAIYWSFEHLENMDSYLSFAPLWFASTTLKSVKLAIARIALFVVLVLANFSWSRGPLCVKIELGKATERKSASASGSDDEESSPIGTKLSTGESKPLVTILGYGNVYGSSYFLFVINITLAILLVSKPIGALSICMMIIQLLSLLELFAFLELRRNLIAPVMLGILAYQHYFSTGHQATIPSIQWDVGFITTQTIVFPFTHMNIALNTFGSFLIICVSVPLVTLWRIPPSPKPITVLLQIVTNITTLLTYQTLTSVMSFIFAAHFRRHLMVWKIFAPRFMFSALLLIVFNLTLIVVTLVFATWRVLIQVNRIFGK